MWDLIVSVPDHCLSLYFSLCNNGYDFLMHKHIPGPSALRSQVNVNA